MMRRMETKAPTVNRWLQLVACVIAMMAIANLQYAWTLFTIPLTESLDAKLSEVQFAFGLFVLLQTWLGPVQGMLIDRLGTRVMVSFGAILVGLGWVGSGYANSLPGLYFWYGLGGVGDTKGMLESAFRDRDIKWIVNAKTTAIEPGLLKCAELDDQGQVKREHEVPFKFAMVMPAFKGVDALMGVEGEMGGLVGHEDSM